MLVKEEATTKNLVNQNVYDMGKNFYAFESLIARKSTVVFLVTTQVTLSMTVVKPELN